MGTDTHCRRLYWRWKSPRPTRFGRGEVQDDAEVRKATERLVAAGLADKVEENTTCCHARQNKVWATEPEGIRWEWYRVIEDVESNAPA